jgi:cellulose synthase/poly-beta-1,6-N-acetylglucosamine synthase-like glycosyltransferase
MMVFVAWLLAVFAVLLAVPTAVLFLEVVAGCFLSSRPVVKEESGRRQSRIAVLIPAHDEAIGLHSTLDDVKSQLHSTDRLVVVADNCADETAAVAASSGADVSIRNDPTKIGKGYALDWGIDYLSADPPEIVIIVDADCRLAAGAIDHLAIASAETQRPVQALYLMTAPAESSINHQVAEFAWRLKNWVRPLGLSALSLPCQLMGTGMAFPWHVIRSAELSSGFIVEDLKLGLELASAGHPPLFCPTAIVTSTFPTSAQGARMQRHRWEQGHVGLILTKAPPLLYAAMSQRSLSKLALALDLIVLPISLLGLCLFAILAASSVLAVMVGVTTAFAISTTCVAIFMFAIAMAWFAYGRVILPLKTFALIPAYVATKIYLYRTVLFGKRVSRWVRADRTKLP